MQTSTQHLIISLASMTALVLLVITGHDPALPINTLCVIIGASGYGSIVNDIDAKLPPIYKE